MRPFFSLSLCLAFLPLLAPSVQADLVFEVEPNDTLETANPTLGIDDLGFAGSLTIGDVDTMSLFITHNAQGEAFFAFDVDWSAGTSLATQNSPQNHWLVVRFPLYDVFAQVGLEYNVATFFYGVYPSPAQVYYLQLFSTMSEPDPFTLSPVLGSTVVGNYRLTNIRGLEGTTVRGTARGVTAVPEPSGVLLGAALIGSGLWLRRRCKTQTRSACSL